MKTLLKTDLRFQFLMQNICNENSKLKTHPNNAVNFLLTGLGW